MKYTQNLMKNTNEMFKKDVKFLKEHFNDKYVDEEDLEILKTKHKDHCFNKKYCKCHKFKHHDREPYYRD